MCHELRLIDLVERLIAEENHSYTLYKRFGKTPQEHVDKVLKMRRNLKAVCANRRLEIIAERNKQNEPPKQQTLF